PIVLRRVSCGDPLRKHLLHFDRVDQTIIRLVSNDLRPPKVRDGRRREGRRVCIQRLRSRALQFRVRKLRRNKKVRIVEELRALRCSDVFPVCKPEENLCIEISKNPSRHLLILPRAVRWILGHTFVAGRCTRSVICGAVFIIPATERTVSRAKHESPLHYDLVLRVLVPAARTLPPAKSATVVRLPRVKHYEKSSPNSRCTRTRPMFRAELVTAKTLHPQPMFSLG